ncbi:carboxymuconolactone decarboxylase family protein [Pseudoduganella lutea]|uniref:Carboxymuconolactone decarboxylase family protein n=2 Tax=Pseudoduganella lutea TaxID=321985 RepID=A0A4V0Z4N6_9BURK|nr:carboxymuconolactone decarboxylase family protein [Pseudoduganella lutea]
MWARANGIALGGLSIFALLGEAAAQASKPASTPSLSSREIQMVAPALENYTQGLLLGDVWARPDLSPRDRSIVTLAVLIARNEPLELPFYLNRALDNGVTPGEISEIITHLAFYAGWPNAMAAVSATRPVFAERKITSKQLPLAKVQSLPLDKQADDKRAKSVDENFGKVAPGVVQYTTDALFRDLWLRPGLAPRDRSMVTVSALVASGQVAQIPYHLNRAMDSGLTETQASEMLTQLAFYAGWPNVFSAMPVFKDIFAKRTAGATGK